MPSKSGDAFSRNSKTPLDIFKLRSPSITIRDLRVQNSHHSESLPLYFDVIYIYIYMLYLRELGFESSLSKKFQVLLLLVANQIPKSINGCRWLSMTPIICIMILCYWCSVTFKNNLQDPKAPYRALNSSLSLNLIELHGNSTAMSKKRFLTSYWHSSIENLFYRSDARQLLISTNHFSNC